MSRVEIELMDNARRGAAVDPLLGKLFAGKYQVNDLVAKGGMGRVYRARQRGVERWVALKVLHGRHSQDESVVKRFYTEMRATARIEHPHTVRVYDFGHSDEGDLFLVMELLRGPTLAELMDREAPLAPERVARIGARIARALEAAHAVGVVHRDLKPENVLVTEQYGTPDWVKVLDFGLARMHTDSYEDDQDMTAVGKRVGTPLYMSPEYIEHRQVDPRSDLYALGAVLYEMATGALPYKGTARQVLQQQIHRAPKPPRTHRPELPRWLNDLIVELMRSDPEERPRTATHVAQILEVRAEQRGSPVAKAVKREVRDSARVFAVAMLVALSIVAVGLVVLCLAVTLFVVLAG